MLRLSCNSLMMPSLTTSRSVPAYSAAALGAAPAGQTDLLYFVDDHSRPALCPSCPSVWLKELSDSLAPDAIVCADAGNNRVWMLRYFQTKQAGAYFGTYGIAGMSWSLPAALTAKLLNPDRQCVSVRSDGFAMQNHVLTTAPVRCACGLRGHE